MGFKDWNGSPLHGSPYPPGVDHFTRAEVMFRNGQRHTGSAQAFGWGRSDYSPETEIVSYRVIDEEFPWGDCKVVFDIEDDDSLWEDHPHIDWPRGWSLCETDGTGARLVAVFRVEVLPTIADGQRVLDLLRPYN